jgi:hypothetical protein
VQRHPVFPAPSFIKEGVAISKNSNAFAPRDRAALSFQFFDIQMNPCREQLSGRGSRGGERRFLLRCESPVSSTLEGKRKAVGSAPHRPTSNLPNEPNN